MIYLAWSATEPAEDLEDGPWAEVVVLAPGLRLIDSPAERSPVYHALKDALPRGTPLLVAALPEGAKFKGLTPGATAWLRDHR